MSEWQMLVMTAGFEFDFMHSIPVARHRGQPYSMAKSHQHMLSGFALPGDGMLRANLDVSMLQVDT